MNSKISILEMKLTKNRVGISIPKYITAYVMGYNSASNRIIVLNIQEQPFNFTIIDVCTLNDRYWRSDWWILWKVTTKNKIDQTPKKDGLIIIGKFNENLERNLCWKQLEKSTMCRTPDRFLYRLLTHYFNSVKNGPGYLQINNSVIKHTTL